MPTRLKVTGTEFGSIGFKHSAGYVRQDSRADLSGPRGVRANQDAVDTFSEIGSSLLVISSTAARAKWAFKPYSEEPEDIERARFFDSLMHGMTHSWPSLVRSALTMLAFGFSPHEVVYKRLPAGRIGWAKVVLRPQSSLEKWDLSPNGDTLGFYQRDGATNRVILIPAAKLLNFTTRGAEAGPEGVSLLRSLHWDLYRYKTLSVAEGIGVERALAGLPVMTVPAEALGADAASGPYAGVAAAAKEIVQNLRADADSGVVMPAAFTDSGNPLYSLQLLSASGSSLPDTSRILGALRLSILQALQTSFFALGHSGVGSYALGDSKVSQFEASIEAFLDLICETVQHQLVPRTLELNGWDVARPPKLVHLPLEKTDIAALGTFISAMVNARVLTADDPLEDHVRRAAELPARDHARPARPAPERKALAEARTVAFSRDDAGQLVGARITEDSAAVLADGLITSAAFAVPMQLHTHVAAPIVTLAVPAAAAPIITVQAPPQPQPRTQDIRIISMPSPPETTTTVEERDVQGRIRKTRKRTVR